jgi:Flp pilus assembly protein TadG
MRAHRTPKLTRFFRSLKSNDSGNAMLFFALSLPVLVGAAGYGTDMAQLYMWKRELQHSVDQAALAGAYALADDAHSTNYATRAQQEFDANQDRTAGFATTPNISLARYNVNTTDDPNSVVVSASATKQLPFSGFLTGKALTVNVSAQATFAAGATYKACLMALKEGDSGTFTVGGSATVHAKCGLGALSCEDDAITVGGSATVDTDSIATCGTVDVPSSLDSVVSEHASVSNPFSSLPAPQTAGGSQTFSCPKKGAANLSPGTYKGGINAKCDVTFAPGIYVIDGGTLDLTDQKANVYGNGVMFVLKNGASIALSGQGNKGTIDLSPMEAGDFDGTANEQYKDMYGGMLFYEDTTGQTSPVTQTITGNANMSLRGTLYLPNSNVQITGNSSTNPLCFQIWSSTINITGNATLSTTCSSTESNSAGSTDGKVRLVA